MSAATMEALFDRYHGHVVPRAFNGGFITLSFAVSLIGAASTLELLNRRTSPKGKFNQYAVIPRQPLRGDFWLTLVGTVSS